MDNKKNALLQNSELYTVFKDSLMSGERILWWGSTAKGAKLSDKGSSAAKPFICFGMALMPIMLLVPALKYAGPIISLMLMIMPPIFVWIGVVLLKNLKRDYAVTNMRIFYYDGSDLQTESIEWLSDIEYQANEKNIGSVTFNCVYPGSSKAKPGGIYGIEDPEEVSRILISAVEKLKKGESSNGQ